MKIKLLEIRKAENAINKILHSKLESKASYRLAKMLRVVKDELQIIEDRRQTLVKQFGKEEKQGVFTVLPENADAYYKAFDDFLESNEADIAIQPITLDMLKGIELMPIDFMDLGQFFVEEGL